MIVKIGDVIFSEYSVRNKFDENHSLFTAYTNRRGILYRTL